MPATTQLSFAIFSKITLINHHSLLYLFWPDRKAPLLTLQERVLLRQGLPKVILEGTPTSLRAGLADARLLSTCDAQFLQPGQSYQRLISVHISQAGISHAVVQSKQSEEHARFSRTEDMTADER